MPTREIGPVAGYSAFTSKTARELAQVLRGETEKTTKNAGLAPPAPRPGIGVTNSSAKETVDKRLSGGVASPLEEGSLADPETLLRTYHGLQVVTAVDGLFTFEYKAVESITMLDGNNSEVVFLFQDDPPA